MIRIRHIEGRCPFVNVSLTEDSPPLLSISLSFKDEAADKCTEYCRKAIECDPNNPEAYQLMASCLLSQQNMEEARDMLEKSLELWQGKDEELPQVCKGFASLLIVHLL